MNKKVKIFIFFIFSQFIFKFVDSAENSFFKMNPEVSTEMASETNKVKVGKEIVVVTANQYATDAAFEILKSGGNAIDAAVATQLVLGLVEPQSSGIGGGSFALYYDKKQKKIFNYDGRERAPKDTNESIFLDKEGKPKKFFDAVIGGQSVGVPGTLKMLYKMQSEKGKLQWRELFEPALKLSFNGFYPSPRLIKSLKRDKYVWTSLKNKNPFINVLKSPNSLITNFEYGETLKNLSKDHNYFYNGKLSEDIVKIIRNSKKNPGFMRKIDLSSYQSQVSKAICKDFTNFSICGPNLPSSGGILILQAITIFESLNQEQREDLNNILEILNYIYKTREILGDPEFEMIPIKKLTNKTEILKSFNNFKNSKRISKKLDENFYSTSHFSILDSMGNVISMTSSIENSFGSRLFVKGFFLNNQLTDFEFSPKKNGISQKNKAAGGKRPLSSMTPIIVLDKEKNFLFSTGSPGGTAIISYVIKTIIDVLYFNKDAVKSINEGNYIKKNDVIYLEKKKFDIKKIKKKIKNYNKIRQLNLTSGLTIIQKRKYDYLGAADPRRDGTVQAK